MNNTDLSRWTDTDRALARKAAEAQMSETPDLVGWCHTTHPHDMIPRHEGFEGSVPRRPSNRKTTPWDPEWINAKAATAGLDGTPDMSVELADALDALPGDAGRFVYAVYGLSWSTREAAAYFGVSQSMVTRKARQGLAVLRSSAAT